MEAHTRFDIYQQLGEGSFSKIFHAFDRNLNIEVALKVEKEDKHKKILKCEFEILKNLQDLPHIPKLYDFVDSNIYGQLFNMTNASSLKSNPANLITNNPQGNNTRKNKQSYSVNTLAGLNFIEMELLGKNVTNFKKSCSQFNSLMAYEVLLQMLDAIEGMHNHGYIHRDIKPTNFVIGRYDEGNLKPNSTWGYSPVQDITVYMVDFGLAKNHLDKYCKPLPPRINTDFRGTLTYASLNAHYKKELSRRDDMWSFFFMVLDLLNEVLPWRTCKDDKEEIKKMKEICINDPEKKLFLTTTKDKPELLHILRHLKTLSYDNRPNYTLIRSKLMDLRQQEMSSHLNINHLGVFNEIPPVYSNNPPQVPFMNCGLQSGGMNYTPSDNCLYNNIMNSIPYNQMNYLPTFPPLCSQFGNYNNMIMPLSHPGLNNQCGCTIQGHNTITDHFIQQANQDCMALLMNQMINYPANNIINATPDPVISQHFQSSANSVLSNSPSSGMNNNNMKVLYFMNPNLSTISSKSGSERFPPFPLALNENSNSFQCNGENLNSIINNFSKYQEQEGDKIKKRIIGNSERNYNIPNAIPEPKRKRKRDPDDSGILLGQNLHFKQGETKEQRYAQEMKNIINEKVESPPKHNQIFIINQFNQPSEDLEKKLVNYLLRNVNSNGTLSQNLNAAQNKTNQMNNTQNEKNRQYQNQSDINNDISLINSIINNLKPQKSSIDNNNNMNQTTLNNFEHIFNKNAIMESINILLNQMKKSTQECENRSEAKNLIGENRIKNCDFPQDYLKNKKTVNQSNKLNNDAHSNLKEYSKKKIFLIEKNPTKK